MMIRLQNEYKTLRECILRTPSNMPAHQPINQVQAFYFSTEPPDLSGVRQQYDTFQNLLISCGVKPHWLSPSESPFQIFTRDIGFAIGERFFISHMMTDIRRLETPSLVSWLASLGLQATQCPLAAIEGGDILIDYPFVYVGVGARTSEEAATWLSHELDSPWSVVQVYTDPKVLHLDCVLNILASDTILYCPSLIGRGRKALEKRYLRRISVSEQEVFDMACNVLALAGSRLLIEAGQTRLQRELASLGFHVDALDWSEIRKYGGLFRCAICPLERLL